MLNKFETARRLAEAFGHEWATALRWPTQEMARDGCPLASELERGVDRAARERLATMVDDADGAPERVVEAIARHHREWWRETAPVVRGPDGDPLEGPSGIPCPVLDEGHLVHTTGTGRIAWTVDAGGLVRIGVYRPAGRAFSIRTALPEGVAQLPTVEVRLGRHPWWSRHATAAAQAVAALVDLPVSEMQAQHVEERVCALLTDQLLAAERARRKIADVPHGEGPGVAR